MGMRDQAEYLQGWWMCCVQVLRHAILFHNQQLEGRFPHQTHCQRTTWARALQSEEHLRKHTSESLQPAARRKISSPDSLSKDHMGSSITERRTPEKAHLRISTTSSSKEDFLTRLIVKGPHGLEHYRAKNT